MLLKRIYGKLVRLFIYFCEALDVLCRQGFSSLFIFRKEQSARLRQDFDSYRSHFENRILKHSSKTDCHHGKLFNIIFSHENNGSFNDLSKYVDGNSIDFKKSELKELYNYCRLFEDFRSANLFRNLLCHAVIKNQTKSRLLSKDSITAALEMGEHGLALDFLDKKTSFEVFQYDYPVGVHRTRNYHKEVRALALSLARVADKANAIWENTRPSYDNGFFELINGRSVAIVGPAPTNYDGGSEIDDFDVVVRTNYFIGSNDPIKKFGSRTDVSYYNHYRVREYGEEIVRAAKELKWIVLRNQADQTKFRGMNHGDRVCSSRPAVLGHPAFFLDTSPQGVPAILYDLLRFAPSKIKIFSTNFYNSSNQYASNYKPNSIPAGTEVASIALRIHEPFGGFNFVKNFYSAGLCEADELTAATLDLSVAEYASQLQSVYGLLPVHNE